METPPSTERTGPQKGDVIDGSLEIEAIIAEGTTSTVVAATDRETGSKVAIKIARGSDLEGLERFRRAGRAMARLKSPFTVKVLAVGETQDGLPCMSMEYLEGKTLALTLLQRGALPIDDAVRWIKQAAESVAEAHAKSFLHRDLDAENLFLAIPPRGLVGPPSIRVLDYGLAPVWRTNKADGRLKPGEVPGTSFALPPELVRGADLDERVDLWGLGTCLYRLLTNKYPFTARNLAELCAKLLAERAPDVTKLRPEVTPALAAVVKRCLEREPDDRFPSVKALIVALDEAQDDAPNTPQVPTERAMLEDLRETPLSVAAAPQSGDDPTAIVMHSPQTVRMPPEPDTLDGPSTQPLGRLSPFAELPRPAPTNPESVEITPSSSELSIVPQLVPVSDKFAVPAPKPVPAPPRPLPPKVSPHVEAQETIPRALPRVSAAMAAQETIPGGSGPPPPAPLVFPAMARTLAMPTAAPTPAPLITGPPPAPRPEPSYPAPQIDEPTYRIEETPRKKRGGLVMLFVVGIAGAAAVGLYAAKARVASKPAAPITTPSTSVSATASESFSVTPAPEPTPSDASSAEPIASAEPITSAEPEPETAAASATHHRPRPRPPTTGGTGTSTAAPAPSASHGNSVYDPSLYDPR